MNKIKIKYVGCLTVLIVSGFSLTGCQTKLSTEKQISELTSQKSDLEKEVSDLETQIIEYQEDASNLKREIAEKKEQL